MVEKYDIEIIRLSHILSSDQWSSYVLPRFKAFSCKSHDVTTFLQEKAVEYERRGKSRTYIVVNKTTGNLLGYFTLSLKAIDFKSTVSKTTIKDIDGFSKNAKSVAVALIGQLGKNSSVKNNISGDLLLETALEMVYQAKEIIGGRICLIETKSSSNNSKVIDFYKRNGFIELQTDRTDSYMQMFKKL